MSDNGEQGEQADAETLLDAIYDAHPRLRPRVNELRRDLGLPPRDDEPEVEG